MRCGGDGVVTSNPNTHTHSLFQVRVAAQPAAVANKRAAPHQVLVVMMLVVLVGGGVWCDVVMYGMMWWSCGVYGVMWWCMV